MIAFDTNILIYAEDPNDTGGRHGPAVSLLSSLAFAGAIVPVQVLGEFANVCRTKKLVPMDSVIRKVANFALIFESPATVPQDIADAALLANRHDLQFFDALIITVATRDGATVLLSEDMQDRQEIGGLTVLNPFNPDNAAAIAALLASSG